MGRNTSALVSFLPCAGNAPSARLFARPSRNAAVGVYNTQQNQGELQYQESGSFP